MIKPAFLLLIILVIWVDSTLYAQGGLVSILQIAESDYRAGDWSAASAGFENLIDRGVSDSAIYVNLGHAYAQEGRLGLALLNYRRAERLRPRDSQVLGYIASIIAMRRDQNVPVNSWLNQLYRLTADLVTADELGGVALLMWNVTFVIGAVWQLGQLNDRLKSSFRLVVLSLAVLVIPLLLLLTVRLYVDSAMPDAIVIVEQTTVRSGPAAIYMDFFDVYQAAELRVLAVKDGWAMVELSEGRLGWLPAQDIQLVRTSG